MAGMQRIQLSRRTYMQVGNIKFISSRLRITSILMIKKWPDQDILVIMILKWSWSGHDLWKKFSWSRSDLDLWSVITEWSSIFNFWSFLDNHDLIWSWSYLDFWEMIRTLNSKARKPVSGLRDLYAHGVNLGALDFQGILEEMRLDGLEELDDENRVRELIRQRQTYLSTESKQVLNKCWLSLFARLPKGLHVVTT